ncbi:nucleocapsid [Orthohantavirus robinaense]|uniref:Nucleoprotein n=1 Tax=Orthohantavirus robinaense TaxID=3052494 RepID=A0A5Q5APZ9_9VIRU|nr:nucleocapsid [Orthohantavirus robinaense]QED22048.1 nucleocapsid [Orthohantavirus robinaense]
MASLKELEAEQNKIERELAIAQAKMVDAKTKIQEMEKPDDLDLKVFNERADNVANLKQRLEETRRVIAEQIKRDSTVKPQRKAHDLDEDEHLNERSSLRYGNVVDLNDTDIDEPSGSSADWLKIVLYLLTFPIVIVLKALYMLTTRGRQTVKENKGNRIRFRDDSSFTEKNGVKTPRHLYVSLPTGQSSMKADEITPGRYKTAVCGLYAAEAKARKLVSPVMGVIGFNYLAEKWDELASAFMLEVCPFIDAGPTTKAPEVTNAAYFARRKEVLRESRSSEICQLYEAAKVAGCKLVKDIMEPHAPWVFACAPDRCPPTALYVAGMAELGAFFSILQDMRNTIMASKLVGTAEEKLKRKSSFYQSYLRRTQSMGIQLDQRIIVLFMITWGKAMTDHFHLGDDMDSDLRKACQALIDEKVKQISNQDALKL